MCSSRTERATLLSSGERIDPCGVPVSVALTTRSSPRMPALRNAFTRARTRLSPDACPHPVHETRVRDFVETGFDVALHDPLVGVRRQMAHLGDRVMGPALRAEPVGAREEIRLEDRLQHQLQGCLDYPIPNGGDPEATQLAARLGDH